MRIGFIKRKYVPFGGGENYLERLMRACRAAGHDVHLVTTAWPRDRVADVAVHPVRVDALGRGGRMRVFSRRAALAVRDAGLDLSFSLERTAQQDVWRAGEGVHRVWLQRRRRWQPAWRAALDGMTPRHRAMLALEAAAACNSPLVIANSRMVQRDLEQTYPERRGRIRVIYNGVDDARFSVLARNADRRRVRAALRLPPRRGLLLFVGSGFRRKGLHEALAALTHLPDCELLVFGRDRLTRWRDRVRRLDLRDRVRFMPPTSDLAPYYHAADVVVLPSWFDPFPSAGLEALRCGTPLVSSRFAGVHELIDLDVNGDIVDTPAHIAELTGAIHRQLDLSRTHTGRADAIAASVSAYTMQRNVEETLAAIQSRH